MSARQELAAAIVLAFGLGMALAFAAAPAERVWDRHQEPPCAS